MKFSSPFEKLNKNDVNIAGGKGASLGEMTQVGIPVPEGFVVLATTFDHFLHETDLTQEIDAILQKVDYKAIHTVESASEKIQELIEKKEVPEDIASEVKEEFKKLGAKFVAVRSSATAEDGAEHAWAGQLDSFLNTTEENLLENIKKCWSSLFTPRAIFYRFEKELHGTQISVAVVVQKMIQSEISGIAFSVHPITEDHNQLIIEAGFGLGEAIVSGAVTPDSYVVKKEPRKIIDINVNTQKRGLFGLASGGNEWKEIGEPRASSQVLNERQISELANLVIKIENHYGFPCDIEWAYEDGKFYIVQSRPITTLKKPLVDSGNLFEGYTMVYLGKRLAGIHEASLKVLAYSKIWNKEIGVGYKIVVMNSLGELYVDIESREKVHEVFITKDFAYAQDYIQKLYTLRDEVTREIHKNPLVDFTEKFAYMMAYFFIIKSVFEIIYKKSSSEEQKIIEKWRNDDNLFEPLDLYYKTHSEDDQKNRKEWSWVFIDRNLKFYDKKISFSSEEKKRAELKKEEFEIKQIIKGNVAFPGIVRGKVRLILLPSDKNLMQDGEIIVAPMTTVDFMSIMKKASAFVTNEGGITSHAAIVAREMKKPCIIGTKVATEVLKSGDEIEVDADNGIVRILK